MSSSRASSWEQSRRKPWSMLSSHGKHLEKKGRDNSENLTSAHGTAQQVGAPLSSQTPSISSNEKLGQEQVNKEQFEYMDLFRQMAFGGTVGAFTGVMFGFMDGMREAQSSKLLKNASNSAKARFLVQGSSRAGLIFGSFFSGFQAVKYATKVSLDPGVVGEIGIASVLSMVALGYQPTTRVFLPYGGMLICMDSISAYMRENP